MYTDHCQQRSGGVVSVSVVKKKKKIKIRGSIINIYSGILLEIIIFSAVSSSLLLCGIVDVECVLHLILFFFSYLLYLYSLFSFLLSRKSSRKLLLLPGLYLCLTKTWGRRSLHIVVSYSVRTNSCPRNFRRVRRMIQRAKRFHTI